MKKFIILDSEKVKSNSFEKINDYNEAIKRLSLVRSRKPGEVTSGLLRAFFEQKSLLKYPAKTSHQKSVKKIAPEVLKSLYAPEFYDISCEMSAVPASRLGIKGKDASPIYIQGIQSVVVPLGKMALGGNSPWVSSIELRENSERFRKASKKNKKDTAVILIHGWNGNGKETWGKFPALLQSLNKFDVYLYNYPTGIGTSFLERIRKLLDAKYYPTPDEVARALKTVIDTQYSSYKTIYLLAHSLGGVIARDYVLREIREGRKKQLRVAGMILYGSPFNGTEWDGVCKLLQQVVMLRADSDYLKELQSDWNKHIAGLDWEVGAAVKAKLPTYAIIGGKDGVVDKMSASFYANRVKTVLKSHTELVKPVNLKDEVFQTTRKLLLESFPKDI